MKELIISDELQSIIDTIPNPKDRGSLICILKTIHAEGQTQGLDKAGEIFGGPMKRLSCLMETGGD